MFLYGKNSVSERLKNNPQTIKKIFLQTNFNDSNIEKIIKSKKIAVDKVTSKELFRIKNSSPLQGIVAEIEDFVYADFYELLDKPESERLSLIFLDRINDPQNLGAILRIAACFGGIGIVIPKHEACAVNDTVIHVASGGENFVPVSMVTNMVYALKEAKKSGYWVAGAVVENGEDVFDSTLAFPLALVLGSEGCGIRLGIQKYLDFKLRIPMKGANLSFNVTSACSIFCYEINRQLK